MITGLAHLTKEQRTEYENLVTRRVNQLAHAAALLTKFDRPFTDIERRAVEQARHDLDIALRNDDYLKAHG